MFEYQLKICDYCWENIKDEFTKRMINKEPRWKKFIDPEYYYTHGINSNDPIFDYHKQLVEEYQTICITWDYDDSGISCCKEHLEKLLKEWPC